MRWLVEVTGLGKTDTESLHIESESWQKALQVARAQRGEESSLSGFSIELLDDGCRALDPFSRLRYAVRRAPEDAAPTATAPPSTTLAPPHPSALAGEDRRAAEDVPRGSPPPAAPLPLAEGAVEASAALVFKREQDATDDLPLTYREYAFLVAPGTSEAVAETLLLAQLARVRSLLERAPPGRLVHLGVFDQVAQGKPKLPPLATLCWKDWRVDPTLVFPRKQPAQDRVVPALRAKASASVPAEGAGLEVSVAPAAILSREASVPPAPAVGVTAPQAPRPATERPPPPRPGSQEPALHAAALSVARSVVESSKPEQTIAAVEPSPPPAGAESDPFPSVVPPPTADKEGPPAPANSLPVLSTAQSVTSPGAPLPITVPTAPPAPSSIAPATAAPTPIPTTPPIAFPAPIATPPPLGSGAPAPRALATISIRQRVRAEDLITDLFEVMHDLHFLRDAVEGGYFCLNQAMDKIPSCAGLVHLYDIDRRSFLVTSARGADARALLLRRHPENDPILSIAMRKRRAVLMTEALRGDTMLPDRYAELGGAHSLVVAPVMQSGRFLGAIELVNPLDGQPFTESEANALTYIADQFSEFVAARGVVTDPERIGVVR